LIAVGGGLLVLVDYTGWGVCVLSLDHHGVLGEVLQGGLVGGEEEVRWDGVGLGAPLGVGLRLNLWLGLGFGILDHGVADGVAVDRGFDIVVYA